MKMKKRIKKQLWLSPEDATDLKRKAKLCDLAETADIRILISGFVPWEQPDPKFYDAMQELSAIENNISQLAQISGR